MADLREDDTLVAGVTRLEERQFTEATRAHPSSKAALGTAAFFSLLMLGGELALLLLASGVVAQVIVAVLALTALLLAWKTWNAGRDRYRTLAEWTKQVRFELTARSLRSRTEKTSSELDWELFESFRETRDLFLLSAPASVMLVPAFIIMPKAAFASAAELDQVRQILTERIRPSAATREPSPYRLLVKTILLWVLLIVMLAAIYLLVTSAP